jgi:N-acyl-D-aspartate/D-glutamate deacylase
VVEDAVDESGLCDEPDRVRKGFRADVTLFDPDTVVDRATFEDPQQYPHGIPYVVVNGVVVLDGGTHTGALPGQVIRGPGYGTERAH